MDPWGAARPGWVPLDQHSEDTRDHAAALLSVIAPELPDGAARSAVTAAYLHDVGKAHRIWQDALCGVAAEEWRDEVAAGRPWAKSGTNKQLLFEGGVAFRHELASLLILDGPLHGLLAEPLSARCSVSKRERPRASRHCSASPPPPGSP